MSVWPKLRPTSPRRGSMSKYQEPLEWKSAGWWRNRSEEERLAFLKIPPRIQGYVEKFADNRIDTAFADDWEPSMNMLITGGHRGKSTMAAFLLQLITTHHKVAGRWVAADKYIEMLKDSFDNGGGLLPVEYGSPYTIKNIKNVFDIVVIDGLGDERLTDFAQHEIGSLIRTRYDNCRSTIVTSSLTMDDIKQRYGDRLASPLGEWELEVM